MYLIINVDVVYKDRWFSQSNMFTSSKQRGGTVIDVFYPILVNTFLKEYFSVTLLLLLQTRAFSYDFFTPALVFFIIFFTFRAPYINVWVLLFESFALGEWEEAVVHYDTPTVGMWVIRIALLLIAQIGGVLSAAGCRVYFDTVYGVEVMSALPGISPALQVNITGLKQFDSYWNTGPRLSTLFAEGLHNGTVQAALPLGSGHDLGITATAFSSWYILEDASYVFLLLVSIIHIWLVSGASERQALPSDPFKKDYWNFLFKLCFTLTVVFAALYRAFPTAHGGFHVSLYKYLYQTWNPNVNVYDSTNGEITSRVFGQILGLFLAWAYNKMLTSTLSDECADFYYALIWGVELKRYAIVQNNAQDASSKIHGPPQSHHSTHHSHGSIHPSRRNSSNNLVDGSPTLLSRLPTCAKPGCENGCNCGRRDIRLKLPGGLDNLR